MSEEINIKAAEEHFNLICNNLVQHNCNFNAASEEFFLSFTTSGEKFPVTVKIMVDAERNLIRFFSRLSFDIPDEKKLEIAVAVTKINYSLSIGNFNLDIDTGEIYFSYNVSYLESKLGNEAITYIISALLAVVDDYSEKLLMLSKGYLTLEKFMEG